MSILGFQVLMATLNESQIYLFASKHEKMINWYFYAAVIYSVLLEPKKIFHWKYLSTVTLMKLQNTLQCSIYSATLIAFSFWGHISYFLILKGITIGHPWKWGWLPCHSLNIYVLPSNRMKEIKSTQANKFPFVCFSMLWELCSSNFKGPKSEVP